MQGGYKGYYKNNILDSSYEYIYCKLLEGENIKFKTHEINYQLNNRQYTPDFFIYDKNDELIKIVEIRGHRLNLEQRIEDVIELESMLNITAVVLTEKDLKLMCKDAGLSYNKLKTEWRESPFTKKNRNDGEFNAMFGKKQSNEQKRKSSEKGKERFKNNPEKYHRLCTSKMIEYNVKNNYAQTKKPRSKRVEFTCEHCGKVETLTECQATVKRFCSLKCANDSSTGLEECRMAIREIKNNRDMEINNIVLKYINNNPLEIMAVKLNKIQTSEIINSMVFEIFEKLNIKDMRTISEAVCGKPSRKEFVKYLKTQINASQQQ